MTNEPKLLIMVSSDFGELANALYFTENQPFDATFLIPVPLSRLNESLPRKVEVYSNLLTVISAIRRIKPDLLMFFSGYLFAPNSVMAIPDMMKLMELAIGQGCRIATTDPFLGVLGRRENMFSAQVPARDALSDLYAAIHTSLCLTPHLYLVDPGPVGQIQAHSFFNPAIMDSTPAVETDRRWVFVLSNEDYRAASDLYGRTQFTEILTRKFHETTNAGAVPVLIAPKACIEFLASMQQPSWLLVPLCGIRRFQELTHRAEYVFYFEYFSSSIAARIMNERPVFFFHRGQLANVAPAVFENAVASYYAGTEPSLLDIKAPMTQELLRPLAQVQVEGFRKARDKFRESPTPEVVVKRLLEKRDGRIGT